MLTITPYDTVTRFDLARTIASRGRYWTTAYLVDGMMVDTGCAHTAAELVKALGDLHLARIVNTHSHEDHFGGNGPLQRRQEGLEILVHPKAIPVLADPRGTQPLKPYRRVFWGWPEPSVAKPVGDSEEIETNHHRFQVIYTPGHSPDHLCLYEPDRGWLFTGDLYVGGLDRALRAGYDIWQIIASLKRLASLPATTLFAGAARVRDNPQQEIVSKIAYLEEMGAKVLELDRKGMSVGAIARKVFGLPSRVELLTLGHFTRRRLVLSYLGRNDDPTAPIQ